MHIDWSRFQLLDLLQKSIFAPLTPQLWGEQESQSPPELGSQCGLGASPSRASGMDLGGISGFLQEVYWLCPNCLGDCYVAALSGIVHTWKGTIISCPYEALHCCIPLVDVQKDTNNKQHKAFAYLRLVNQL